jgi:hypothetical protein
MIDWIMAHWDELAVAWAAAVTLASVVVKLTPSRVDDEWLASARRLLERVALNAKPTQGPRL